MANLPQALQFVRIAEMLSTPLIIGPVSEKGSDLDGSTLSSTRSNSLQWPKLRLSRKLGGSGTSVAETTRSQAATTVVMDG